MEAQAVFPADLGSAASARRFAEDALRSWGCEPLLETARLLISELVVNVVLHVRSDAELRLAFDGRVLRVEVADESTVAPQPQPYSPTATTGRGLMILDALADSWGVDARPGSGKTVWFELPAAVDNGVSG
jgi:anti-sigma regulatory factor (Ser/Thr protein kinase)